MQEHFCVLFARKGHCPLFRRKKHRGIPPATRPRENDIPSTLCSKIVDYPAGFTERQKQSRRQGKIFKNLTKLPSSRDLCTNLSANSILGTYRCRRQKDIFFSALLKNAAQRALACSRLICRTPLPSGAAVNLHRNEVRRSLHKAKQASCKILL